MVWSLSPENNILMHSTSKEAQSLIINILLFFCERDRASVRGGDDFLVTCYECNRHRNEDPHHYERNIYHMTRKEYSQIEANFCIYANYKETSDVYAWYVPCYEPVLTFINLLISLYKCHNCMLKLFIHILEI